MNDEVKDIKVPIRAIVEQSMNKNGARYMEDEFNLLRKYYIACLNLRYLTPQELGNAVDKFSNKIKFIVLNFNSINKLDYYKISDSVLYINGSLKFSASDLYEVSFYKAVTEVVFGDGNKYLAFNTGLCQMVAEKVYNMTENNVAIIMPVLKKDQIGDVTHLLRSGYNNYNLIITLVKEFLLLKSQNEAILIRKIFMEGYDKTISSLFNDNDSKLLMEVLDKIFMVDINYRINRVYVKAENELIEKYQLIINGLFTNKGPSYHAFIALLTTDNLRKLCTK